jgi:large subunit ribosomal protein L1
MAEEATKPTEETIENTAAEQSAEAAAVEAEAETTAEDSKATAKAGKRSEKALKEAEEKQAKEERKAAQAEAEASGESKPKQPVKATRSRLERRGKNFRKAAEQIDKTKAYNLAQALELAVKTNPVKFDASVELHVNLNVDPRHADQNIRDNLVLPAGTGKTVRIAVMDDAKVEGADISGVETLLKALEKGEINFDILISTPAQMPKLGKYARVLGPRGLMPNPKSGTVTNDVAKAVKEAKAGRVEYRVDSTGIVHVAVGKVSFGAKKLEDNARALLQSIKSNKPASVKSTYVKSIHLATTMGPSITVDNSEL